MEVIEFLIVANWREEKNSGFPYLSTFQNHENAVILG